MGVKRDSSGNRREGSARIRGTVISVPIVHGSHAVWLGKKGTETKSHKWVLYLRPKENVDISRFIEEVEFVLHESFSPHKRRVSEMPYELTEYGWGEFDALIRVHFRDQAEKPVDFYHPVKLFHTNGELSHRPVVYEFYDEIVFQDPPEKLLRLLRSTPHGSGVKLKQSALSAHYKDFSGAEETDKEKIEAARKQIRERVLTQQERYGELENERAQLVRDILSRGGRV